MKLLTLLALVVAAPLFAACASSSQAMQPLASARAVSDFDSYRLRRVGLLPFDGENIDPRQAAALQAAFLGEIDRHTEFEVVPLDASDLEEVPDSDPFQRGWIEPRTVIALSHRFHLDGLLAGTVVERQYFVPQRLAVQLDLIAAETGLSIWSSSVHLDASDERVRAGVEAWFDETKGKDASGETWELWLLSPRRFAQFAAYQVARDL